MVTRDSATCALPDHAIHEQIPIDSDHSNMVKFANVMDPHYITVRDRMRECIERAPGIVEARFQRLAAEE
jgi:hypothetical protein